MSQEKITRIASIIVGLILAAVLLYFGFRIVQGRFGQAAVAATNIATTDVTANSFKVTYSGSECRVEYGTACTSAQLSLFAPCAKEESLAENGEKYGCPVTLLSPNTEYSYKLVCGAGAKVVDNAGLCFTAKTAGETQSTGSAVAPAGQTGAAGGQQTQPVAASPTLPPADQADCATIKANLGSTYSTIDYLKKCNTSAQ